MKLFLDIGAFNGALSLRAAESGHYDCVYAFEPNPACIPAIHPLISWERRAVWDQNNTLLFHFGQQNGEPTQGGSFFGDKTTGNLTQEVEVEGIRLDWFVLQKSHNQIDLHLDCEGSEYIILPHLLAAGAFDYVTRLTVEWHAEKLPRISDATDRAVRAMVAALDKPECLVREE